MLKKKKKHLVTKLTMYDKNWKSKYFIISSKCLLGGDGDPVIPSKWSAAGIISHYCVSFKAMF